LEHRITQYPLEQGALEIEYIEEYFGEYKRRKTSAEIVSRLQHRDHLILMATTQLPDDPGTLVPVSYKVAHEIREQETIPKLADLVERLRDYVNFNGRRILYTWIGGTRRDWRGQGHFRALTEQQEAWAIDNGFDEILVKTKNKFYEMRGTLDHLRFDVVKYEPHADNHESKVYLSKKLSQQVLDAHRSMRTVVTVGE
jgi:GNAT superfamily N-acetyltransferase